jgi:hypothetical protein
MKLEHQHQWQQNEARASTVATKTTTTTTTIVGTLTDHPFRPYEIYSRIIKSPKI